MSRKHNVIMVWKKKYLFWVFFFFFCLNGPIFSQFFCSKRNNFFHFSFFKKQFRNREIMCCTHFLNSFYPLRPRDPGKMQSKSIKSHMSISHVLGHLSAY
jgi:hypothetical protein